MTITKQNNFEGLPPTGTITSSNQNSDGTSGTAFSVSTGGYGTCTSTSGELIYGTKSLKANVTADVAYYQLYWWNGTANTVDGNEPKIAGMRVAFRFLSFPTGNTQLAGFLTSTGGSSLCHLTTTGSSGTNRIRLTPSTGGSIECPTSPSLNTVYIADFSMDATNAAGSRKMKLAVYDTDGNYALGTSGAQELTNCTINSTYDYIKRAQIGVYGSTQTACNVVFDAVAYQDTYTLLGPIVVGVTDSRPDATVAAGSWTYAGGASSIHGALADDTDTTYAQSSFNPSSDLMKVSLQPIADGSCVVPFTYWASAASPARSLTVSLRDSSGTQIASKTISNITAVSPVSDSIVLSSAENLAFTDRTNPELWFTAS